MGTAGHIDHGKSSELDALRTAIAGQAKGGTDAEATAVGGDQDWTPTTRAAAATTSPRH